MKEFGNIIPVNDPSNLLGLAPISLFYDENNNDIINYGKYILEVLIVNVLPLQDAGLVNLKFLNTDSFTINLNLDESALLRAAKLFLTKIHTYQTQKSELAQLYSVIEKMIVQGQASMNRLYEEVQIFKSHLNWSQEEPIEIILDCLDIGQSLQKMLNFYIYYLYRFGYFMEDYCIFVICNLCLTFVFNDSCSFHLVENGELKEYDFELQNLLGTIFSWSSKVFSKNYIQFYENMKTKYPTLKQSRLDGTVLRQKVSIKRVINVLTKDRNKIRNEVYKIKRNSLKPFSDDFIARFIPSIFIPEDFQKQNPLCEYPLSEFSAIYAHVIINSKLQDNSQRYENFIKLFIKLITSNLIVSLLDFSEELISLKNDCSKTRMFE